MTFIESERTAGAQYVQDCAATVKALWIKCCEYEKIPIDSMFVVFSDTNPLKPFLETATRQFQEAMSAYRNFGYAGMTIGKSGKAELYKRPKKARPAKAKKQ